MSAEHIENVMEHDDSQTQSETHSTPSYSATRRTARKHKRVVRKVRNCSMPMASSLNRPMCLPNASAMLTTTSVFWASCHRIGACSPSGSADVRLHTGGSDTFRPPEFHIFRMMVLRIRLGMPLRTDDGDDRAVFLGLQYGCRLMRRHGKHRKRVAVRIS